MRPVQRIVKFALYIKKEIKIRKHYTIIVIICVYDARPTIAV